MKQIISAAYTELLNSKSFKSFPQEIEFSEKFLRRIFNKKVFFSFYHAINPDDQKHRWFIDGDKLQTPTGRFLTGVLTSFLVQNIPFDQKALDNFCQMLNIEPEFIPRLEDDLELREDRIARACLIYNVSVVFVFDEYLTTKDKMLYDVH